MSGWVDVAVSVVGLDWARSVIDGGDGWSLLAWTAVFSVAFAAIGFFVGRAFGKRSSKDLADRCSELEARRVSLLNENEKLNVEIRSLESENDSMKSEIKGLDAKIGELEGELEKRRRSDLQKMPGAIAVVNGLAMASKASVASPAHASTQADASDPLSRLVPAEIPFLLRVYDEAQVHVGMENLKVAKSLQQKGVITRTDAPESGVISQCDVTLTPKWALIMKTHVKNKKLSDGHTALEGVFEGCTGVSENANADMKRPQIEPNKDAVPSVKPIVKTHCDQLANSEFMKFTRNELEAMGFLSQAAGPSAVDTDPTVMQALRHKHVAFMPQLEARPTRETVWALTEDWQAKIARQRDEFEQVLEEKRRSANAIR